MKIHAAPSSLLLVLGALATASPCALAQDGRAANFEEMVAATVAAGAGKTICAPPGATIHTYLLPLQKDANQHPDRPPPTGDRIQTILANVFPCRTDAASSGNEVATGKERGDLIKSISPIFGQLVMFSLPQGFTVVVEGTQANRYLREAVLQGESAQNWSQMLTVTGTQGLAANADLTPLGIANWMAGGYRRACPASFSATRLGGIKLGTFDAFAAVLSCGTTRPGGQAHSESALVIVIRGQADYYTIQWAERGAPSAGPVAFDEAKWTGRLKSLMPIKLCPIVPGEPAPYPSCADGGQRSGA